jgi:septal ring factor EnvC (AmiA/AmiB activator)
MNENNIRLAIFYIPAVFGATAVVLKFVTGFIAARKEVALQRVRENSVGETAVQELNRKLEEARSERKQMKEDLKEMKEEFKYFKDEIRIMIDAIRKHGLEDLNDQIEALKKINKAR